MEFINLPRLKSAVPTPPMLVTATGSTVRGRITGVVEPCRHLVPSAVIVEALGEQLTAIGLCLIPRQLYIRAPSLARFGVEQHGNQAAGMIVMFCAGDFQVTLAQGRQTVPYFLSTHACVVRGNIFTPRNERCDSRFQQLQSMQSGCRVILVHLLGSNLLLCLTELYLYRASLQYFFCCGKVLQRCHSFRGAALVGRHSFCQQYFLP